MHICIEITYVSTASIHQFRHNCFAGEESSSKRSVRYDFDPKLPVIVKSTHISEIYTC